MTYKAFDVVVVPFPFTDKASSKRRPAVVLSDPGTFGGRIGHSVLAMVTSAAHDEWPLDAQLADLETAGLSSPSVVRMKLFTLDDRLILRAIGNLGAKDRAAVTQSLCKLLAFAR